jgi:hypothetical protein
MARQDDILIRVHRTWNAWESAEIRLGDLVGVHWFQPAGSGHAFLYGFIWCTDIVAGDIPHECESEPHPHRLCVCVIKKHTLGSVYLELARRADQPSAEQRVAGRTQPDQHAQKQIHFRLRL